MADSNISTNATNGTTPISPEGTIIAYSGLYAMALLSIFYGSLRSADLVRKHRKENKKMENSITFADAKWFPITASCVLFGLYCLFKKDEVIRLILFYVPLPQMVGDFLRSLNETTSNVSSVMGLDGNFTNVTTTTVKNGLFSYLTKENISWFLLAFFCYEGIFAMGHLLKPLVSFLISFLPKTTVKKVIGEFFNYRLTFSKSTKENVKHDEKSDQERKELFDLKFDTHDIVSVLLCALVGIFHVYKRHWLTNNAFGLAFTLYGIEALHLSSFKGGAVLLAGLFVYDIFWVFATEVMSTVATSVNAPILLMFPQDLLINGFKSSKFAMLGLGDIVIPGIFLALLLRFGEKTKKKIYFYATMAAYAFGLMLTIGVMHYFKAAQPALLYLVPACIGCPTLLSLIKGDFHQLFSYDEDDLVKKDDEKEKDKSSKKKEAKKDKDDKEKKS